MPNVRTQGHKWERDVIDTWADKLNLVRFNRRILVKLKLGVQDNFQEIWTQEV
jgi:hypothetical protein